MVVTANRGWTSDNLQGGRQALIQMLQRLTLLIRPCEVITFPLVFHRVGEEGNFKVHRAGAIAAPKGPAKRSGLSSLPRLSAYQTILSVITNDYVNGVLVPQLTFERI